MKVEVAKVDSTKVETSKVDSVKLEITKTDSLKVDLPATDSLKLDVPKTDSLKLPEISKYSMEGSIAGYIDRLFLPGVLHSGIHDPEGLLSTLPAVVTAMSGIFTGEFVRQGKQNGYKRVGVMLVASVVLLATGYIWGMVFPINKNLWTSSFVLFCAFCSRLVVIALCNILSCYRCDWFEGVDVFLPCDRHELNNNISFATVCRLP